MHRKGVLRRSSQAGGSGELSATPLHIHAPAGREH